VALDAQAAALVYIYARISQIAEMTLSFYVTFSDLGLIDYHKSPPDGISRIYAILTFQS
jgi:hypothetical protein